MDIILQGNVVLGKRIWPNASICFILNKDKETLSPLNFPRFFLNQGTTLILQFHIDSLEKTNDGIKLSVRHQSGNFPLRGFHLHNYFTTKTFKEIRTAEGRKKKKEKLWQKTRPTPYLVYITEQRQLVYIIWLIVPISSIPFLNLVFYSSTRQPAALFFCCLNCPHHFSFLLTSPQLETPTKVQPQISHNIPNY